MAIKWIEPTDKEQFYTCFPMGKYKNIITVKSTCKVVRKNRDKKQGEALSLLFRVDADVPTKGRLFFIEVGKKRIYVSPETICFYEGGKRIPIAKARRTWDEVRNLTLYYTGDGYDQVITGLDAGDTYETEKVEVIDEKTGEPVKDEKTGEPIKKTNWISYERVEVVEGKIKRVLYDATNREEGTVLHELDNTIAVRSVKEDKYATITVHSEVDNSRMTVKLDDIYIYNEDAAGTNKYTQKLSDAIEQFGTKPYIGAKVKIITNNWEVELKPLTKEDLKSIESKDIRTTTIPYIYSEDGEYVNVISRDLNQGILVKITDLYCEGKQLKKASDLRNAVNKPLVYRQSSDAKKGIDILPLTPEQACLTYKPNDVIHYEAVSNKYVKTEETTYLMTADGNYVEESCVGPICYDKAESDDECDAYLLHDKYGLPFIVSKESAKTEYRDRFNNKEEENKPVPLKISTKQISDVYVIQTSNVPREPKHECTIVGDIKDVEKQNKAINEAVAKFNTAYQQNEYEVPYVIQTPDRPICYMRLKSDDLESADAFLFRKKEYGAFIVDKNDIIIKTIVKKNKKEYEINIVSKNIKFKVDKHDLGGHIRPLALTDEKDLTQVDIIQTSNAKGETCHTYVYVSKADNKDSAVEKAIDEFNNNIDEYNRNREGSLIKLDSKHLRYVATTEYVENSVEEDYKYIKSSKITFDEKTGEIIGGPLLDVNKKANEKMDKGIQTGLGILSLCAGFPLGAPIFGLLGMGQIIASAVKNVATKVGASHEVKKATKSKIQKKREANLEELQKYLKEDNLSTQLEREARAREVNNSLTIMREATHVLSSNGIDINPVEVRNNEIHVDGKNLDSFFEFEEEYKKKLNECKKLKATPIHDENKVKALEEELKHMRTNCTFYAKSEKAPDLEEYDEFMACATTLIVNKLMINPNTDEGKKQLEVIEHCKIKNGEITYKYKGKAITISDKKGIETLENIIGELEGKAKNKSAKKTEKINEKIAALKMLVESVTKLPETIKPAEVLDKNNMANASLTPIEKSPEYTKEHKEGETAELKDEKTAENTEKKKVEHAEENVAENDKLIHVGRQVYKNETQENSTNDGLENGK